MNTNIGMFTVKTYSMVAPSQESLQKMQAVINKTAASALKITDSVDIAIKHINERDLERQLFIVNGTNERLCLNLEKRLIEFTGW